MAASVIGYLIVFLVTAAVSALSTPVIRRMAVAIGAVDIPDDRKVHTSPTPSLGGLAIYLGLAAGLATAWRLGEFRDLFQSSSEPLGIGIAATAIVLLGAVDDVSGLKAPTKLAGQILTCGALILAGVQVFYFWLPGPGLISLSPDMSALITVVWTLAVINAVNLIDGLDGLAAGISAIAAAGLFAYAYRTGGGAPSTAALLAVIVLGGCLGFLPFNFNPARIFMGDSGSMLLGLLLASTTVSGVGRTIEPQLSDVAGLIVPVLLPLFVLAFPLADTGLAIARRVRGRRPVFHADKRHIHHWLVEMASSHRQAVLVMYAWSATLAGAALVLSLVGGLAGRIVGLGLGATLAGSIVVAPRLLRGGPGWRRVREPIHNLPGSAGQI